MFHFRCIFEGRCRTPVCEFGSYRDVEGRGRCPQKSEQYVPLQEGLEVMPRHAQTPPQPRHVQAPPNPPIPEPSWPRLLPSRPNGVPRVEVPPSWASSDNRKELAWQPMHQGLFVMPTPAALSSRPSIRSAPSTTTTTTTTTTSTTPAPPPAAAPRGPHWDPQPITTAPATYSWQTQQLHHPQPKTHEQPSKHHWATMPKWSFSSSDHNSGFPWNPEETMRPKHNRRA